MLSLLRSAPFTEMQYKQTGIQKNSQGRVIARPYSWSCFYLGAAFQYCCLFHLLFPLLLLHRPPRPVASPGAWGVTPPFESALPLPSSLEPAEATLLPSLLLGRARAERDRQPQPSLGRSSCFCRRERGSLRGASI